MPASHWLPVDPMTSGVMSAPRTLDRHPCGTPIGTARCLWDFALTRATVEVQSNMNVFETIFLKLLGHSVCTGCRFFLLFHYIFFGGDHFCDGFQFFSVCFNVRKNV